MRKGPPGPLNCIPHFNNPLKSGFCPLPFPKNQPLVYWYRIWYPQAETKMTRRNKLACKALQYPGSLSFNELCLLAEYFGFEKRRGKGSHEKPTAFQHKGPLER